MLIGVQTKRQALIPVCLCSSHRRSGLWIFRGLLGIHAIGFCCKIVSLWLLGKARPILCCLWLVPDLRLSAGVYWLSVPYFDAYCCYIALEFVPWLHLAPVSSFHSDPHSRAISQLRSHLCLPSEAPTNFCV